MTHKPPVPAASVSPYPLHPAASQPQATPDTVEKGDADDKEAWRPGTKSVAIGIGSAAIVAALMYIRRR